MGLGRKKFNGDKYELVMKFWNLQTKRLLRTTKVYSGDFNSSAISPNGKLLAVNVDTSILLFDVSTMKQIGKLTECPEFINSITFSPKNQFIAAGGNVDPIKVWNISNEKPLMTAEGFGRTAFSPDEKTLIRDNTFREIPNGKIVKEFQGRSPLVNTVQVGSDGITVASGGGGTIKIWNLQTGVTERPLQYRVWN